MRMNYDDVVTYKEAWQAEEVKARKWKRATLIIFACMVLSFTHGMWARARVVKLIEESEENTNQLVERLASAVSDERFRACVEEIYGSPGVEDVYGSSDEEFEAGYLAPTHLEFDLPESPWENSVVRHSDGTWRVWETKDGKIWGYGDIIEPK